MPPGHIELVLFATNRLTPTWLVHFLFRFGGTASVGYTKFHAGSGIVLDSLANYTSPLCKLLLAQGDHRFSQG